MSIKKIDIKEVKDLNKLRTAPILDKVQSETLFNEVRNILETTDWLTIGIMANSIKEGINAMTKIENKLLLKRMRYIDIPKSKGPIFLKANQKTGEIHIRIEYGLGEGILIGCHNIDNSIDTQTIGPFPLNFFN